ncbi:MAG: CUB domain-containing protein [Bdellovibrionota bacterium]|nr:CUB domain-containing protein [Bdellovibrionota bacterium]
MLTYLKLFVALLFVSVLSGCFQTQEQIASFDGSNRSLKISLESSDDFELIENSSPSFTLVLDKSTQKETEVTWSITSTESGGSASKDFSQTSGIISIPPNTESFEFSLPIIDDSIFERPKEFKWTFIDISSHAKAEIQQISFTLNDDEAKPAISFLQSTQSANEADGSISVVVQLDQESDEDILVDWSYSGTATLNSDFSIPSSGKILIPANQMSANLSLNIIDDIDVELPETIDLQIDGAAMGDISVDIGATNQNQLTIVENDADLTVSVDQQISQNDPTLALPVLFDVRFSKALDTSTFTVDDISNAGTATGVVWEITNTGNDRDFTLKATGLAQMGTIIPNLAADLVTDVMLQKNLVSSSTDNSVTFNSEVGFSSSSISVNENVSGASLDLPINLSAALTTDMVLNYTVSATTATNSGTDFNLADSSISILAGNTSATLSIPINDDNLYEGNEQFNVSLALSSGTANFTNSLMNVTIVDNELAPELSFTVASQHFSQKSAGTTTITISKSTYSQEDVAIPINFSGSTAEPSDHDLDSGLTIEGNVLSKTFNVNIQRDAEIQVVEILKINLDSPSIGSLGAITTHDIILTDPSLKSFSICNDTNSTESWGRLYDSGGIAYHYEANENCGFLIQPAGASSISLLSNTMTTYSSSDYFEVFDGANDSAPSLGVFSQNTLAEVSSTGGSMYIKWISDGSGQQVGFDLQWESNGTLNFGLEKLILEKDESIYLEAYGGQEPYSYSIVSGAGTISAKTFSSSQSGKNVLRVTDNLGATADVEVQIIDQESLDFYKMCSVVSSTEGYGRIVDSGGISEKYRDDENCGFLIQSATATYIEFFPTTFSTTDSSDYLEIYEGTDDSGTKIASFHSSNFLSPIRVNSNNVFLKWVTNGAYTGNGFDISWSSDAALKLTSLQNQIQLGESLTLSVLGGQAPYSFSIVNGYGSISGDTFTASSTETGSVKLRVTDNLAQTSEIDIQVVSNTELDLMRMCSSVSSTKSFGRITDSGGEANGYSHNENCNFLIDIAGASKVTLTPNVFNTISSSDYLVIYAGTNSSGTLIGKFYRADFQNSISIDSSEVFLEWYTDAGYSSTGFDISWTSDAPVQLDLAKKQVSLGDSISLIALGGQAPYSYSVVSGSGSISGNQFTASSSETGKVVLRLTDNLGQTAETELEVINTNDLELYQMCYSTSSSDGYGRITDSNGPNYGYSHNENCGFVIQATGASSITLTPNLFQTHDLSDFLEIYAGTDNSGTKIAKYSSQDFTKAITIESGSVYLYWQTNNGDSSAGFDISWSSNAPLTLSSSKNQIELGSTITLNSLGGQAPYTYSIVSGGGGSITGNEFTASATESGAVVLRVTDNLAQTSEIEIQVINNDLLDYNRICYSTSSNSGQGRIFDSGGAQDGYNINEDCGFLIQPAGATSITLSPTDFKTYDANDYLEIYIGTNSSGTRLAHYTSTSFTKSITIESSSVYLFWHSNHGNNQSGFDISWTSNAPVQLNIAKNQIALGESLGLNAVGGQAPYTYSIISGSGSVSGNTFTASATESGAVVLRVTDNLAQTSDIEIQVINNDLLDYNRICIATSSNLGQGRIYDSGGALDGYNINEDCGFLIQPTGATSINLTPNSFETYNLGDYLDIYIGTDSSGTKLKRYSRTDFNKSITINSSSIYILWHSDHAGTRSGFDISWTSNAPVQLNAAKSQIALGETLGLNAVGGQAPYSYSIISGSGSVSGNTYTASSTEAGAVVLRVTDNLAQTSDLEVQVIDPNILGQNRICYSISSTEGQGTITDSGGGSYYSDNEDCGFLIQPTGATSISLTPNSFSTRDAADYLEVYIGTDSSGTKLKRYSRTDFNKSITINSSSVYLFWHSNHAHTNPGFDIAWTSNAPVQLKMNKQQILLSESLTLNALGGEAPYSYSIVNGAGSITGNSFTASSSETGAVEIKVVDNLGQESSRIVQVDRANIFKPNKMCYARSSQDRSGKLYDSGGDGVEYSSNQNCNFLIQVSGATSITLNPKSFSTVDNSDYLTIYSGTDNTGSIISRYSHTEFSSPIIINSDSVYLEWVTDPYTTDSGFEIDWFADTSLDFYTSQTHLQLSDSIDLNISGGLAPYTISIESGEGSISGQSYTASSSKAGIVKIKVEDSNSNSITKELYVYDPLTIPSTSFCYITETNEEIGRIYDDGGSGENYSGSDCGLLINIPSATSIVLEAVSFKTYEYWDSLTIYQGTDNTGTVLGMYSSSEKLTAIEIPSNQVYLEWVVDNDQSDVGFELIYHSKGIKKNLVSSYYMPPSNSMRVQNLSETTSLSYSVLSGLSSFTDNNLQSTATSENVQIQLDDSVDQISTNLVVLDPASLTENVMCTNTTSTDSVGRVFDPGGSAGNYGGNELCGFLIAPTGANNVYLNTVSFNTFHRYDWLEVYDGTDDSGKLIGRYMVNDLMLSGPLKASSGSMYLKWESSAAQSSSGFELLWTSD